MNNSYVNDFRSSVKVYYKELRKCNPISREEEVDLIKKAKNNNLAAQNKILTSNLQFVFDVAKNYKGKGVDLEDLISEGNMGLIKAMEKFDVNKDVKFISYAVWWIRQSIQDYIKRKQKCDSIETKDEEEEKPYITYSATEDDYEDDYKTVSNDLIDENDNEDEEIRAIRLKVISEVVNKLDNRGKFIVTNYFGINNTKPKTLEEIGNELGITKERTRQIKDKSLRIIRSEVLLMDETKFLI